MKSILVVFIAVLVVSFAAVAYLSAEEMMGKTVMLTGTIVDNLCADSHKDALGDFVKSHTKDCALMPSCVESGYSLYSMGKRYWFDKVSSAKIADFLKKADSKLDVAVEAEESAGQLRLISIKNQ